MNLETETLASIDLSEDSGLVAGNTWMIEYCTFNYKLSVAHWVYNILH